MPYALIRQPRFVASAREIGKPSGARVWVRFARVRGQVQSEWSTPVLVTTR